jgi:hypothetical protein
VITLALSNPELQRKLRAQFAFESSTGGEEIKNMSAMLSDLYVKYQHLNDAQRQSLLFQVAGRTQASRLTAMLDNTSQVHCNQHMIDSDPSRYIGGQLIIFGGIPFNLCLGLSCTDVGDNALADLAYATGRHTAPLFAGDTAFASTEIKGKRDVPNRPDLCIVDAILRGYKYVRKEGVPERTEIFYLERALVVKRRAFFT